MSLKLEEIRVEKVSKFTSKSTRGDHNAIGIDAKSHEHFNRRTSIRYCLLIHLSFNSNELIGKKTD